MNSHDFQRLVEASLGELRKKSRSQIDRETAFKWAARSLAALELADQAMSPEERLGFYLDAEDYLHEAMEHAATSLDLGLVEEIRGWLLPQFEGVRPNPESEDAVEKALREVREDVFSIEKWERLFLETKRRNLKIRAQTHQLGWSRKPGELLRIDQVNYPQYGTFVHGYVPVHLDPSPWPSRLQDEFSIAENIEPETIKVYNEEN